MTTITIPATRKEMVTTLTGWQNLITATQWSKAATLAAFVELPGKGGDRKSDQRSKVTFDRMTCDEFAALGIAGLRSKNTIRAYVRRWIATTRPIPQPGDQVDLDGLPEWDTEEAAPATAEVMPAPPTKEPAPKRRKWDDLTPEEQAADNAIAEEGARELVRMAKVEEATEDTVKRGQGEGTRMALEAGFLIGELVKHRHYRLVEQLIERAQALLDLEQAQDLTPEMFHD